MSRATERLQATAAHLTGKLADLFTPLTLPRGPAWPNKFMLAPLTNCQSYPDGKLSEDEFHWLTMRAKGGIGLVMTCAAHVQARGQGFPGQLGIWSDDQIPGLARLAAAIKSYGSVSSVQLHHAGLRSPPDLIGEKPVGPSENAEWGARALSLEEVEQLKSDFIEGAVRAEKAGFDGVELHGAHGYILCAFNSSETNLRKDGYGGDLWHRTKILFDIIDGIRARCRPDFQLGVRLSPERFGIQLKEQIELVRVLLERQKLDYLDLSLWDCFKKPVEKEFAAKPLLDWFSDIPRHGCRVGCAGKLYAAEDYKRVLEHGYDFVIVGRAAILHHDLPQLVAKDPNWRAIKTPAPKEHLAREGLSPRFITYMNESFKGFVAN